MKKILISLLLIGISLNVWTWDIRMSPIVSNSNYVSGNAVYSLPDPSSLPEITWEELMGHIYTVIGESGDFIIVEVDGKLYVFNK